MHPLKENKRDYAVDKLGGDRSAYHSSNESVPANERVGAVPLFPFTFASCATGCFSETRVALLCGCSENNPSLRIEPRRDRNASFDNKKRFPLCALILYVGIFFLHECACCACCTYSTYFSKLTRCPRSFISPPLFLSFLPFTPHRSWLKFFFLLSLSSLLFSLALCSPYFPSETAATVFRCEKTARRIRRRVN
jgi:hypothetical protein